MTKRQNLLNLTWAGPAITIAGREIILSPVRYALLSYWQNCLFTEGDSKQNPAEGMGEMILAAWATKDEIREIQRMTPEQRQARVMEFMLEHEDEVEAATAAIEERMKSIQASAVEPVTPGKPEPALVSSPA
jgi:hypothetical protein